MNQQLVSILTTSDNLLFVLLALVAVIAILGHTIRSVVASVVRERTRREIAAYIAEGSMSPDQGERLMAASKPRKPA